MTLENETGWNVNQPNRCSSLKHFLRWALKFHLDEKSTEDAALVQVVSREQEKGVAKNGKGTKESWFCELLNTKALIPSTHPQILAPFPLVA